MGKWYYLNASLERVGPITSQTLKVLADNGIINQLTTLISEDGTKMYEAGDVQGLFSEVDLFAPGIHDRDIPTTIWQASFKKPTVGKPQIPSMVSCSVSPSLPPSPPTSSAPDAWASGVMFPGPLSPTGPTIKRKRPPRHSNTRLFIGIGSGLFIVFICVAAVLEIRRVVVSSQRNSTTDATVVDQQKNTELFNENLVSPLFDDMATSVPMPPIPAPPSIPQRSVRNEWTVRPPSQKSVTPQTAEKKRPTWFDDPEPEPPEPPPISQPPILSPEPETKPKQSPNEDRETSDKPKSATSSKPLEVVKLEPLPPLPKPRTKTRSVEEIVAEVEGAVALISGKSGSGSGFIVLPGIVVTNSHVIADEDIADLEISFPSESGSKKGPFKATLLYEDSDRDLAFLRIPSKVHSIIPIVQAYKFRRGQRVIAIGNPGRGDGQVLENAVCEGILSSQTELDGQPYYQLSIAINHGNSGGPILDNAGNVLGVATLKGMKTEAMGYCVPPDALHLAIESLRRLDSEKVRETNEQHRQVAGEIGRSCGMDKLAFILRQPAAALENPSEELRELVQSAILDFDKATQQFPDEVGVFVGRAVLKLVLSDWTGVLADLDTAVRLEPNELLLFDFRNAVQREIDQREQRQLTGKHPISSVPSTIPDMNRLRPLIPAVPSILGPGQRGMRPPFARPR